MAKLHIYFPPTPYTNEIATQRLIELGAPRELLKENQSRAEVIRGSIVLGSRMAWGEVTETSITIVYKGAIPKGVEIDLRNLHRRGVITSWGKDVTGQEGRTMFEDLVNTWQELGNMLADVAQNFGDMHPDDVIGILDNCTLKATELTQGIVARRQYIQELRRYWKVTPSGVDRGMPPAKPPTGHPPPVTQGGPDIS